MSKKQLKTYGRLKVNKLDWLLAIACCVIAVGALWISLGISIANAGDKAGQAFLDVGAAFGFVVSTSLFGQSAVVIAYNSVILYGSIALLVLGTLFLLKKGLKERIPGLVAELVAAVGFCFLLSFVHEYIGGSGKGSVNGFWPISLIVFLILLCCIMVFAVWATFNTNYDVSLKKDKVEDEQVEEQPVEEEQVAEEVKEEPVQEASEEEIVEDDEEEVEEDNEEDDEDLDEEEVEEEQAEGEKGFTGFGKRHKRVPFENKIRRADPETRQKYKDLVAGLREYDFNDRKSIPGETFSYKKEKMVFITISGKTLRAYFNINPAEFADSPIPIVDVSEVKKYSATPSCLKIKSNLAVRRAIALGRRLAEERNVPKK